MRSRPAPLLAVLLALATSSLALPPEKERWIELRSANFTLFSNESRARTRELALRFEMLRETMRQLSPDMRRGALSVNSPLPTFVYVFDRATAFQPYRDALAGPQSAGLFSSKPDGNYIVVQAAIPDPVQVAAHEYLHYFLHNNYPAVPAWLDEGLAEFYSSIRFSGSKVELGHPVPGNLQWLQQHPPLPPGELARSAPAAHGANAPRGSAFYASSWLLTHYLVAGSAARREQLGTYLELLKDGEDPGPAFVRAFGGPPADLDAELREYARAARSRLPHWTVDLPEFHPDDTAVIRELARHEVLARLGRLLVDDGPAAAVAEEHLQAALALEPRSDEALLGLGLLRTLAQRSDEAAEFFRRAAEAAPANQLAQFYRAQLLLEPLGGPFVPGEPPPAVLEARRLLERSVRLNPAHAESRYLLGLTYLFERGRTNEAIAQMQTALELLPERWDLAANLAGALAFNGEHRRALELLQQATLRAPDEATRAQLERQAGAIREQQRAARAPSAPPRPDRPPAAAPAPPAAAVPAGSAIDPGYQKLVDRYNEAVELANAGKLQRALALMEEVSAAATGDLGERARALVTKWRARLTMITPAR
ncbi:MAG: tetratricopeptide repeat protein [Acidobacteria bacterium]|nr:tetratricopeptide repeat protein [Acidobacteriota bacterium]